MDELRDMFLAMGYSQPNKVIDMVRRVIWDDLREEFVRCLTVDSETRDRRRKDFNNAIFDPERGYAVYDVTDMVMVMEKFDQAVRNTKGQK